MFDRFKELTPVFYGESGVKLLDLEVSEGLVCFDKHWHDRMEILFITSGEMEIHIGDAFYRLKTGEVAVINPGEQHAGLSGKQGVEYYTVMFDLSMFLNSTFASQKYIKPIIERTVKFENICCDKQIVSLVGKLIKSLKAKKSGNPLQSVAYTYSLISGLFSQYAFSLPENRDPDEKAHMMLSFVNENFTEKISASTLSRKFGYDEAYFCRKFKELTGMTASQYITTLRLEYAMDLMKNNRISIKETALQSGFYDLSYFSKCFKKHFGLSPADYRMKLRTPNLE